MIHNPNTAVAYAVGIKINEEIEKVYWTDSAMNTIMRCNLDGTEVEIVIDFGFDVVLGDLTFDYLENKIYWVEAFQKKIQRADFDGSNIDDVVTHNLDNPVGIVLQEEQNKMFWVERGTPKEIMISNLNGEMEEQIVLGDLNFPYFIAILEETMTSAKESQESLSIRISPNPVEDELTIITDEKNLRYEIIDLNGRVAKEMRIIENKKINVSDLTFGFYFLHFISKKDVEQIIRFEKK